MAELRLIISDIDDDEVEALAEALAEADATGDTPLAWIEHTIREIDGGRFAEVEVMEYEVNGVRNWF